jgi:hypothetical protein
MSLNFTRAGAWHIAAHLNPIVGFVSVMSWFRGSAVDWRREVRIRELRLRVSRAFVARDEAGVRLAARELFAECDKRSPRAQARLERRVLDSLDPHARAALEK